VVDEEYCFFGHYSILLVICYRDIAGIWCHHHQHR